MSNDGFARRAADRCRAVTALPIFPFHSPSACSNGLYGFCARTRTDIVGVCVGNRNAVIILVIVQGRPDRKAQSRSERKGKRVDEEHLDRSLPEQT
jgi:hypothetical protein